MSRTNTRYDLLLLPEDAGRRIAPRAGEALLRHLATTRVALPNHEAVADEWVEVYCAPGPSAHEPFVKGMCTDDEPIFEELVVRFGTKAVRAPYGVEVDVNFFVEFRGCLYDDVLGPFKSRFKDILYTRPALYRRLREEPPAHREVSEDEQPKDRRRRKKDAGGVAGTRVEEW